MRSKTIIFRLALLLICTAVLSSCNSSAFDEQDKTITVSAAASLTLFLDDIIKHFEAEHEDIEVLVNYGSSGSLQRQIEQGAPIDLFLSAGTIHTDRLHDKGLLYHDSMKPLLRNSLVIIEHEATNSTDINGSTSTSDPQMLLEELFNSKQPRYIAIGEPDTVPAGIYAKQALEHAAIWEQWETRYVYGKDVKEVLAYVEQGNADIGIVYASDALTSKNAKVIFTLPAAWHDPILYMGAIVEASEQKAEAALFLSYLSDLRWKERYEQYGFEKVD